MWYSKKHNDFLGLSGDTGTAPPFDVTGIIQDPTGIRPFAPQGVTVPFDEGGNRGRGPGTPGPGAQGFSILPLAIGAAQQSLTRGITLDSLKSYQKDLYKKSEDYYKAAQISERTGDVKTSTALKELADKLESRGAELERLMAEKRQQEAKAAQAAAALAASQAAAAAAKAAAAKPDAVVAQNIEATPPVGQGWWGKVKAGVGGQIEAAQQAVADVAKKAGSAADKLAELLKQSAPMNINPRPQLSEASKRSMEAGEGMTNRDYKAIKAWESESRKEIFSKLMALAAANKKETGSAVLPGIDRAEMQNALKQALRENAATTDAEAYNYEKKLSRQIKAQYGPAFLAAALQSISDPENGIPRAKALWESMWQSALASGVKGSDLQAAPPAARPGTGDPEFYAEMGMPGYEIYGGRAILESSSPRAWEPEHGVEEGWNMAKKSGKAKLGAYGRSAVRRLG
jgi:hypothetical protein